MILHVDMDAFFASVEQRDNPALKGKPVVVSGRSKRSVVSAASYEARTYGIHSAMPMFQAVKKCPNLIAVPGDRGKYARDSKKIMSILGRFSPLVEPVSIDEAYVDVRGCEKLFGSPRHIALQIKESIFRELSLTCSVGAAPVRFLAKIASDMNKPDGLTLIAPKDVDTIIKALPIGRVPGVGRRAMELMDTLQIKTLADIQSLDQNLLHKKLGKMGNRLLELSRGIDPTPVEGRTIRKSISSETTLARDISDHTHIRKILLARSQQVGRDLRGKNRICRHVTIKIKFSDFSQITRGKKTRSWISSSNAIYKEAKELLERVQIRKKIRLLGVGVSDFMDKSGPVQMSLIPDPEEKHNKQWEFVDNAVDSVLAKFGTGLVQTASLTRSCKKAGVKKEEQKMRDRDAVIVNITGKVQGVFFRAETRNAAINYGLAGYVKNMPDGSVQALLQGNKKNIETMIHWCHKGSPLSRVDGVTVESVPAKDQCSDFQIRY